MVIYQEVFKEFQRAKVKYLVVGGIAMNLLGGMRATSDLDVLVELSAENLNKIVKILKKLGYKVRIPVDPLKAADDDVRKEWLRKKNLKALNFYLEKDFKEVDLIIDSPVDFKKADSKALHIKIGGFSIPVISLDHLVIMKRKAGRPVDLMDIKDLKKIKKMRKQNE